MKSFFPFSNICSEFFVLRSRFLSMQLVLPHFLLLNSAIPISLFVSLYFFDRCLQVEIIENLLTNYEKNLLTVQSFDENGELVSQFFVRIIAPAVKLYSLSATNL